MNLLSSFGRKHRIRAMGLSLAMGLTAGTTLVLTNISPQAQSAILEQTEAKAHQREVSLGTAVLGQVYLQAGDAKQSARIDSPDITDSKTVLGALNQALDPLSSKGGLYSLRKAFEAISIWVLIPLFFLQIAKIVATGVQSDAQLVEVVKKLFLVVAMMATYTLWDVVVFRMISIPMTQALNSPDTYNAVAQSIVASRTNSDVGRMANMPAGENPLLISSNIAKNADACNAIAEVNVSTSTNPSTKGAVTGISIAWGDRNMSVWKAWWKGGSNETSAEERAPCIELFGRQFEGGKGGKEVDGIDIEMNPQGAVATSAGQRQAAFYIAATRPIGHSLPGNFLDWLTKSATGILSQFLSLLVGGILWFVWLGIIVGRAFSLCLAPLALAMGMNNLQTAHKWFLGHATIVMKPVAMTLGVLFIWALNLAIFSAPLGGGMIGLGAKIALAAITIYTLLKSNAISQIAAGDVTAVATQMGSAVADRTVQAGWTTGKGLATGAGMLRNGGFGKLKEDIRQRREKGASMLRGNDGTRWGKIRGKAGRELGDVVGVLGGAVKVAKWGANNWEGGVSHGKMPAWKNVKGATSEAYKGAVQAGKKDKLVVPTGKTAEGLKDSREREKASNEAMAGWSAEDKEKVAAKPGENLDEIVRGKDLKTLEGMSRKDGEKARQDAALLMQGLHEYLGTGTYKTIEISKGLSDVGLDSTLIGRDKVMMITQILDKNPALNAHFMAIVAKDLGGEDKVKTNPGSKGKVLDVQAALQSEGFMNAMSVATEQSSLVRTELVKRQKVSKKLNSDGSIVGDGSLTEGVARDADPVYMRLGLDGKKYRDLMQAAEREGWYAQASPADRKEQHLPEDGGAAGRAMARNMVELHVEIPELAQASAAGSAASTPPHLRESINKVIREREEELASLAMTRQARGSSGGAGPGIDLEESRRQGVNIYVSETDSLFSRIEAANPGATSEEVYRQAETEARRLMAKDPRISELLTRKYARVPGESDENYEARRNEVRQKLVFTTLDKYMVEIEKDKAGKAAGKVAI